MAADDLLDSFVGKYKLSGVERLIVLASGFSILENHSPSPYNGHKLIGI